MDIRHKASNFPVWFFLLAHTTEASPVPYCSYCRAMDIIRHGGHLRFQSPVPFIHETSQTSFLSNIKLSLFLISSHPLTFFSPKQSFMFSFPLLWDPHSLCHNFSTDVHRVHLEPPDLFPYYLLLSPSIVELLKMTLTPILTPSPPNKIIPIITTILGFKSHKPAQAVPPNKKQ